MLDKSACYCQNTCKFHWKVRRWLLPYQQVDPSDVF